uniref:Uncharacterized protein AlNc14C74G5022 n=1 Tax=Albugo laibachii Nc14 TaxID=890382 RepID=F0WEG8_9STRA|nr:conserved hypothetical protein [Albugo laibachii Nc14]|eukprot:CCA19600.1 conserved hypothetical protein [Albugo laibachii Nc14]
MLLRGSLLLAVSGTTALGLLALYYASKRDKDHRVWRWISRTRPAAPIFSSNSLLKASLSEYQKCEKCAHLRWVSICGTLFDITCESTILFHPLEGCYARWLGHDVTEWLILCGVDVDKVHSEDERSAFDKGMAFSRIDFTQLGLSNNTKEYRRYKVIEEWYKRFCLRYPVIGQATDLFATVEWALVRQKWHNEVKKPQESYQPKCPLGFGSKKPNKKAPSWKTAARMISFYGKKYDVRGQPSYEPDGPLAHFVGHDITYAVANGSKKVEHLDVEAEYSFDQQLLLDHYQTVLEKKYAEVVKDQTNVPTDHTQIEKEADIAALLQRIVSEGDVDRLKQVLGTAKGHPGLNEPCPRSGMTLLHRAVENNHAEIARLLMEAGADTNAKVALYEDATPLDLAKRFAFDKVENLLSQHSTSYPFLQASLASFRLDSSRYFCPQYHRCEETQLMDPFHSEKRTTISLLDLHQECGKELQAFCERKDEQAVDHKNALDNCPERPTMDLKLHSQPTLSCTTAGKTTRVDDCVKKMESNDSRACCVHKSECRILRQSLDQLDKALTMKGDYLIQDIKSLSEDLDALTQAIAQKDPVDHLTDEERNDAGSDSVGKPKVMKKNAQVTVQGSSCSRRKEGSKSTSRLRTTERETKRGGCPAADKDTPRNREAPRKQEGLLSSLVVWRKYQDAGFKRHIRRQMQARAAQVKVKIESGRRCKARMKEVPKRAKTEAENSSSTSSTASSHSIPSPVTKIGPSLTQTYLKRYAIASKGEHAASLQKLHSGAREGVSRDKRQTQTDYGHERSVLVYRFDTLHHPGAQAQAAAYIVCKSLEDLAAKAQTRLGVPNVTNLYRDIARDNSLQNGVERLASSKATKRLQRITRYQQLQESDHIYITQNSREDIDILCSWLRLRQQRQKQLEAAMRLGSKTKNESVVAGPNKTSWSKEESKQLAALILEQNRDMAISYSCSLYDAEGKKVAIKKRYPV